MSGFNKNGTAAKNGFFLLAAALLLASAGSPSLAAAQGVSLQSWAEPSAVPPGGEFAFNVEARATDNAFADDYAHPRFGDFEQVAFMGPRTTFLSRTINGVNRETRVEKYWYNLRAPEQPGSYLIGPASVETSRGRLSSNVVEIVVTRPPGYRPPASKRTFKVADPIPAPAPAPMAFPAPMAPAAPAPSAPLDSSLASGLPFPKPAPAEMFLLPEIERKSLRPWEPVRVAWWLYVSEDFDRKHVPGARRFSIASDLEEATPEFFAEFTMKAESLAGGQRDAIRGNAYRVVKVAEAVLVPRQAGEMKIPNVSVEFFRGPKPRPGDPLKPALAIGSPAPTLSIPAAGGPSR